MNSQAPDFYLSSSEGYALEQPRMCFRMKRLKGEHRDDYLLIRVNPPLAGQEYGLGQRNIDKVVIATRHKGESLFPITSWPVCVHVAYCLVEDPENRQVLRKEELESIAWAELYQTEEAARLQAT